MSHRVVEVSTASFLTATLTHLVIQQQGEVVARVPIEDLGMLIIDGHGHVITHELIAQLAVANVCVIFTDEKHIPVATSLALTSHHLHAKVLRSQIDCGVPTQKRIWQSIIQGKIESQAQALEIAKHGHFRVNAKRLRDMKPFVRSGDSDNIEAQAARLYWGFLFGEDFTRDRDEPGVNACLNYGYAILRAAMARALVGTGLHPALGIHHHNQFNAFALADDAMEPLRPLVDLKVLEILRDFSASELEELTPALKKHLLEITVCPLKIAGKTYPFMIGLPLYAATLKQAICREKRNVIVPGISAGVPTESCGSS